MSENTLLEYFSRFKENLDQDWLNIYIERCNFLQNAIQSDFDYQDEVFLNIYWREGNNGICSVKPGMLSHKEFRALLSDLPELSRQIAADPSPDMLDTVLDWAQQAKTAGQLQSVKKGVFHRFFCSVAPQRYCTLINHKHLKEIVREWNTRKLGPQLDGSGNWATLNSRIVQAVKQQGLEQENYLIVNRFIYRLKVALSNESDDPFAKSIF